MFTETEHEQQNEVRETSEEDMNMALNENEKEETVQSDHAEEQSPSNEVTKEELADEEAAICEPEENRGTEILAASSMATSEDLDVKLNEVNEQPLSQEESVVFEINSNYDNGPSRLHLDTPERDTTIPAEEEDQEAEEGGAVAAARENIRYEEYMQIFHKLCEDRDKATQLSSQLQMKLADYLRKKAGDDSRLERNRPETEQLQQYEKYITILINLKQQITADSETAQLQAEELRLQSQEKLDKVENEWQALVALKQDVAVAALGRRLGKETAQARVESTLAAEQLRQDKLIKLRLRHIKKRMRIHRLEAVLCEGEEHSRDPLLIQFVQLQAAQLEQKRHNERQNEESSKLEKKISSCLELLSNIREKLYWSQMEVQAKRGQLAEVEAAVARKRDILTRTKQARNNLQRDNLRLKERRGLLGNRVLLRDFEDTMDASDYLEKRLENLKCCQAEITFNCGRWKKNLERI